MTPERTEAPGSKSLISFSSSRPGFALFYKENWPVDEDVALIAHRRSLADLPADVVKPVEDDVDVRGSMGVFASNWSIAPIQLDARSPSLRGLLLLVDQRSTS